MVVFSIEGGNMTWWGTHGQRGAAVRERAIGSLLAIGLQERFDIIADAGPAMLCHDLPKGLYQVSCLLNRTVELVRHSHQSHS